VIPVLIYQYVYIDIKGYHGPRLTNWYCESSLGPTERVWIRDPRNPEWFMLDVDASFFRMMADHDELGRGSYRYYWGYDLGHVTL
jgi:hypothetical protein